MHRSYSIKQVTQAKVGAHTLPFATLQSLMAPCLRWCNEIISHPPKDRDLAHVFRSRELEEAAHKVFPFSCHTEFSQSLMDEFSRFIHLRDQLASSSKVADEVVVL